MLAPSQMKFETVREPRTKSHSEAKASSFAQVARVERPVGLAEGNQIRVDGGQARTNRSAITLTGLDQLASPRPGHLLGGSSSGVVVDHEDLVNEAECLEAVDALGDAVLLVVRRKDHRDRSVVPHGLLLRGGSSSGTADNAGARSR